MNLAAVLLPYLLLVTFGGTIKTFDSNKIKAINESPYQGVAVALIDGDDPEVYTIKDFQEAVNRIKADCRKHIWPWVFFNRMIGYNPEGTNNRRGDKPYFRKIKGIDLYDEAGALSDFLHHFRLALRVAKDLGSPGVFIDPESYNNYLNYQLTYVAEQLGRTPEETKERMQAVGGEIIDVVAAEYPQAILWFGFTGLATPLQLAKRGEQKELLSPAFIVQGMLARAKELGLPVKIVSGGQVSLGYCQESLAGLQTTIQTRQQQFAPWLSTYPQLALAGTIAPWADARRKSGWLLKRKCGQATMQNLDDFKPLFRELLQTYRYIWIYAAGAAGYDPYSQAAQPYNAALRDVLQSLQAAH